MIRNCIKDDEHKCYIWHKIVTPDDMPTIIVGCCIPLHYSSFYDCLDRYNLLQIYKEDISYFIGKGVVIVFGEMKAYPRILQHDAQQFFMTHISRMDEDIHNYDLSSVDEKDQDQYGKCAIRLECLLQMTYLYEMIPIILHLECIMEVVWLTIWYSQKVSWITSINN